MFVSFSIGHYLSTRKRVCVCVHIAIAANKKITEKTGITLLSFGFIVVKKRKKNKKSTSILTSFSLNFSSNLI